MSALKTAWSELIGLFVDDGSFALAIAGWVLACWLILPRLHLDSRFSPVILFAGLVFILVESATRRARQK